MSVLRTAPAFTQPPPGSTGIDDILAVARGRLRRISPHETHAAVQRGATLIDIRPAAQRAEHGEIPGAIIIERNVLEWRFDPMAESRLPVAGYAVQVVVFCSQGYSSSLAAASLLDLGVHRAADMVGGFQAWRDAGLPVVTPNG